MQVWTCVLALICGVAALESSRDARWLFGGDTITKVVIEKRVITEVVPSSCVEVLPSLPPCRQMRELNIVPSPTERIVPTAAASLLPEDDNLREGKWWGSGWSQQDSSVTPSQYQHDENAMVPTPPHEHNPPPSARPDGWSFNDLFNGFYTTVTTTVLQKTTTSLLNRDHVVTFSVVGCMPTRLPFDLDACHTDRVDIISLEPSDPPPATAPLDPPATAPLDPRGTPDAR